MQQVMQRALVKQRPLRALPSEISSTRISNAVLPVKIEAARLAIAKCTDLPELLRYKDQAEGLAAAVRAMQSIGPEMVKAANEMVADAWRKGGQLLTAYSSTPDKDLEGKVLPGKSARSKLANSLGLLDRDAMHMVRVAAAPKELVYDAIKGRKGSLQHVAKRMPRAGRKTHRSDLDTDAYKSLLRGAPYYTAQVAGLIPARAALLPLDPRHCAELEESERKRLHGICVELIEKLDALEQALSVGG